MISATALTSTTAFASYHRFSREDYEAFGF